MFVDAAYVALKVPDLDQAITHYTQVLGLRELSWQGDTVFLSHGPDHPSIQLSPGAALGLDHVAFAVADESSLGELRGRLEHAGVAVLGDEVDRPGIANGLRFRGPTGHLFEAVVERSVGSPQPSARQIRGSGYPSRGVRPNRLAHITIQSSDVMANVKFAIEVLGFKLTDYVGPASDPILAFVRCNNDHHTLGFAAGPDGLHHLAFEVSTVVDLADLGDTLYEANRQIMWGPGRHLVGDNIAMYHHEPSGTMIEYYTDMQRIFNDQWQPRVWEDLDDYRLHSVWGGPKVDPETVESTPCLNVNAGS